jgi:hypothetical protein
MDPNVVKVAEDDNYRLAIIRDEMPESPREWDNLGTMICWHRRYDLGDENPKSDYRPHEWERDLAMEVDETVEDRIDYWESGNGWTRLDNKYSREEAIKKSDQIVDNIIQEVLEEQVLMLPVSLYDHSGLTMWVGDRPHPFDAAGWDSGQVGWIYVTKEQIRKNWGIKRVTKKYWKRAEEILEAEVKTVDQYLRGDIYGFVIETVDGEELDSCWGFYGDDPEKNGMKDHIEERYHYLFDKLEDQY